MAKMAYVASYQQRHQQSAIIGVAGGVRKNGMGCVMTMTYQRRYL